MSPPRRRHGRRRPPRRRGRGAHGGAAVVGVLVVTAALYPFLRPGDDSGSQPPTISTPLSVPEATLRPNRRHRYRRPRARHEVVTEARVTDEHASRSESFESSRPFPLDAYLAAALGAIDRGESVLVARTPTGSGKTVVAECAMATALDGGGKAFYTTPLKALSSQKFGDFNRSTAPGASASSPGTTRSTRTAPVVVMTTEVLRNMIYAPSSALEGLPSWCSTRCTTCRTVPGARCGKRSSSTSRPTSGSCAFRPRSRTRRDRGVGRDGPGRDSGDRAATGAPRASVHGGDGAVTRSTCSDVRRAGRRGAAQPGSGARLDSGGGRPPGGRGRPRSRLRTRGGSRSSRCCPAAHAAGDHVRVQPRRVRSGRPAVRVRRAQADQRGRTGRDPSHRRRYTDALSDEDLEVLRYGEWITGLEAGLAAHHAGMVPR